MSDKRYGVSVETWAGQTAGAEHYYGEVWTDDREEGPMRYRLIQPMTAKMAARLNEKDRQGGLSGTLNKEGMWSRYFETEQDVIDAGVRFIRTIYGYTGRIELGLLPGSGGLALPTPGLAKGRRIECGHCKGTGREDNRCAPKGYVVCLECEEVGFMVVPV